MKTPIYDFVKQYISSPPVRLHMPGHKGIGPLGFEKYDITEILGADALYEADGIIAQSEANATHLFGTGKTLYSTEGSSHAIKAMLYLAYIRSSDRVRPYVLAARNIHKSFLYACALIGCDAEFMYPSEESSLCSCKIAANDIKKYLSDAEHLPFAVYITSPDYLGNIADIKDIAKVCDKFGIPLLVDNAHGAYLGFLESSIHPISLGAYMCADSAHKTLPVLTGGAYLHLSQNAVREVGEEAKSALSLFGSTSPSYLILQSLDLCNAYIADGYDRKLSECIKRIDALKNELKSIDVAAVGNEPLKLTIDANSIGYSGHELANAFRIKNAEPEYADDDYIVCMLTPGNKTSDFDIIKSVILDLPARPPIKKDPIILNTPQRAMSIRNSLLCAHEYICVDDAVDRICGEPTVSCPPAIPIVISGEIITEDSIHIFKKHGINKISVVKQ